MGEVVTRLIVRKCVACNNKQDRNDLTRVLIEHKTGEYLVNPSNHQFGRSIYVCNSETCLGKIKQHKRYKNITVIATLKVKQNIDNGNWWQNQNLRLSSN